MASQIRKGRTFWTPLVAEFKQSCGVTQAAFAQSHSVHPNTLRKWIYKLRDEQQHADASLPVRFVEVEMPRAESTGQITVAVGAVLVHLERLPEPAWLAELVRHTTGGAPC